MIAEGLVREGLAVARLYHDRHHPARRNPYNEVECSSHYARAMSGYGSFISACGFTHHGPRGELGFAPRVLDAAAKGVFRAPFIASQGWGTYEQADAHGLRRLTLRFGTLKLRTLRTPARAVPCRVTLGEAAVPHTAAAAGPEGARETVLTFDPPITLRAGDVLTVTNA
jgi:hypothetical protein